MEFAEQLLVIFRFEDDVWHMDLHVLDRAAQCFRYRRRIADRTALDREYRLVFYVNSFGYPCSVQLLTAGRLPADSRTKFFGQKKSGDGASGDLDSP